MVEYISKRLSGKQLHEELEKLVGQYNAMQNTYLMIYASATSKNVPGMSINMEDYYTIVDLLRKTNSKKLDFYIETPGGSGTAAEDIVTFLRHKFDYVNFVISGEAKSAGTIIALSGNDISMTETGSLGPIDAQVVIGRSNQSAYDYIEWIDEKRGEAAKNGGLNPFDATMVAQISPGELKGVGNALNFAQDLVVDWLCKYKFKDWTKTKTRGNPVTEECRKQRAREIARDLLNHSKWRTHGRSLKYNDLTEIGLQIAKIDDNPDLAELVYRIQTVIRLLFDSTTTFKLFVTADNVIAKQAVPTDQMKKGATLDVGAIAEIGVQCQKCGKQYEFYVKFEDVPGVDEQMKEKGISRLPNNNKVLCDCGFETDLTGPISELEVQAGKVIIR